MSKPVFDDIFAFSGRRNRKSYLLWFVAVSVITLVVWGLALVLSASRDEWTMTVIAGLLSIPVAISSWAVEAQRCRDFGWTGWAVLLTLIPYVGWIFALAIIFIPGNVGPNRYGPDPLGAATNPWQQR